MCPDTNVCIFDAAGRLPPDAAALLDRARLFHCSVCLGELATGVANADPARPGWRASRDHYAALFASVPVTRLLVPDAQVWVEAGLIAGTLARTQRFAKAQLNACLNDALIYLTAANSGLPVLTADRADFALIRQIAPEGDGGVVLRGAGRGALKNSRAPHLSRRGRSRCLIPQCDGTYDHHAERDALWAGTIRNLVCGAG